MVDFRLKFKNQIKYLKLFYHKSKITTYYEISYSSFDFDRKSTRCVGGGEAAFTILFFMFVVVFCNMSDLNVFPYAIQRYTAGSFSTVLGIHPFCTWYFTLFIKTCQIFWERIMYVLASRLTTECFKNTRRLISHAKLVFWYEMIKISWSNSWD